MATMTAKDLLGHTFPWEISPGVPRVGVIIPANEVKREACALHGAICCTICGVVF